MENKTRFTPFERKVILKKAKSIQHTFADKSLFKAIRYTLKYWN